MKPDDKQKIKALFEKKRKDMGLSQSRAAVAAGTKGTTVSQVFAGKYGANDEGIYKLLAKWVNYETEGWQYVETRNVSIITQLLDQARLNALAMAITGDAGIGKTATLRFFAERHPNVLLLQCDEFWDRKQFMRELLTVMGRDYVGKSLIEMVNIATSAIIQMDKPLILMDEADKLGNPVLNMFISLYNRLEDHCGFVMVATDHLRKKLERGCGLGRKGYEEIWSRVGRKSIACPKTNNKDILSICKANGIEDENLISTIIHESRGDLRRVRRSVHAQVM
ncbi:MAG: ATP-binding protein [Bacteroidetes bacterium]|nr:MAG: ATP-binding protein [Bacteroidota bacterium]